MSSKEYFRDCVKEAFRKLSQEEREEKSSKLVQKLLQETSFQQAKTVMAYLPLKDEVDIRLIFSAKKKFCIPKVKRGLIVPIELSGKREVKVEDIDLVIVPGLAFTPAPRRGNTTLGTPLWVRGSAPEGVRIGRGLGLYDRFLAALPDNISTISLAFDFQLFPDLPVEDHDVKVGKVIIEVE